MQRVGKADVSPLKQQQEYGFKPGYSTCGSYDEKKIK